MYCVSLEVCLELFFFVFFAYFCAGEKSAHRGWIIISELSLKLPVRTQCAQYELFVPNCVLLLMLRCYLLLI
uniref:Putative secreted protein n=1 Tax=Psorophora albipes TaxID=869069 RepID=T1E3I1_9DIPT